jgi:hypothetical protein
MVAIKIATPHRELQSCATETPVVKIMIFAAPTSAWRIARDASTSMMMPDFTSTK